MRKGYEFFARECLKAMKSSGDLVFYGFRSGDLVLTITRVKDKKKLK